MVNDVGRQAAVLKRLACRAYGHHPPALTLPLVLQMGSAVTTLSGGRSACPTSAFDRAHADGENPEELGLG
jgi:hypothetical protein